VPKKTYNFVWLNDDNEETQLSFEIVELDQNASMEIMDECKSPASSGYRRNKVKTGLMEGIDMLKFQRLTILKSVTGWSGMTWRLLIDLVVPNEEITDLVNGKVGTDQVPFDIEMRRLIASSPSLDFVNFLTYHQNKIKDIERENLLAALGN